MDFIHLDVHTEYSLLNSIFKVKDIKQACLDNGFDGVGINDFNTLHKPYTIQQYFEKDPAITRAQGVKFTIKGKYLDGFYTLLLYAKNYDGFLELVRLSTLANSGNKEFAHITYEDLKKSPDIICLSGGETGELFHLLLADKIDEAVELAMDCRRLYGIDNYYIELTNHFTKDEQKVLDSKGLRKLYLEVGIPTVACNDVFYWKKKHAEHRDIGFGMNPNPAGLEYTARYVQYNDEFYFKTADEMQEAFKDILKQFPDCFKNTRIIYDQCCDLEITPQPVLPEFPIQDGFTTESYFDFLVHEGFKKRKPSFDPSIPLEEYEKRLKMEMDVIKQMGFVDYHMIVQDFINWAKDDKVYEHPERYFPRAYFPDYSELDEVCYEKDFPIIVGPGRGSAAGSLVCYCLSITDRDPLANKLLFERFLNPERISMPDIDIDLPNQHRHYIVQYLQNKYGFNNVSQIATFQTLGVRSIIKNVGKKLSIPYAVTDELSKNIPDTILVTKTSKDGTVETKSKPVELLSELKDIDYFKDRLRGNESLQELFRYGEVLEGLPISTGKHAAGCIICRVPISSFVPLMEVDGVMVTQYEKHDAEDIGLLKMDLLGLLNLDIIGKTFELIEQREGIHLTINDIPENDPKTFELFQNADTRNVFQFEGAGMRNLLKKIHPTSNEHLNAACALYRPGPMQFIDEYLEGRKNPDKIKYPHESFKEVTEDTYGILVYQEQIMMLVQKMAGFTLGEADILRRGIGKKEEKLILENRKKFVEGGIKTSGLSEELLNEIYDIICKFASYGFNRSHSCAYAWVSYICGYLKANYPVYYMAACLTMYSEKADKLASALVETKRMGINILPPEIGKSKADFSIEEDNTIRFSYNGIKGIGEDIAEALEPLPATDSFYEYLLQIPHELTRMDKIKFLIHSGAFDQYGFRKDLCNALDTNMDTIRYIQYLKKQGIVPMLDSKSLAPIEQTHEYSTIEKITLEKQRLQISLSGHVLDSVRGYADVDMTLPEFFDPDLNNGTESKKVLVIIKSCRITQTKSRHQDMAFVNLEDEFLDSEGVIFPKNYEFLSGNIPINTPVVIEAKLDRKEENPTMIVEDITPLNVENTTLYLEDTENTRKYLPRFTAFNGVSQVILVNTKNPGITVADFTVRVCDELFTFLDNRNIDYRFPAKKDR